jgi:hypothetical protein
MIGIVIEDLKNFDLDSLNDSCDNKAVVFTDCELPPKEYRNLSFFTCCLAYNFNNPLVATCVKSAMSLLDMPLSNKKLMLVPQNLWIGQNVLYEELLNVYNNDNLELVATTKEQADIVESFFKRPIVVENILDIKEM